MKKKHLAGYLEIFKLTSKQNVLISKSFLVPNI